MFAELAKLGVQAYPSEANFILMDPGKDIFEDLLSRGIILRQIATKSGTVLRLTVGQPEENQRVIKALADILAA